MKICQKGNTVIIDGEDEVIDVDRFFVEITKNDFLEVEIKNCRFYQRVFKHPQENR